MVVVNPNIEKVSLLLISIRDYFISSKEFINYRNYDCRKLTRPSDINEGECYRFAYFVYLLVEGCELYRTNTSNYTHAFFKIKDYFYDAECCEGVPNWNQLPFFIKTSGKPWNQQWTDNKFLKEEVDQFIEHWGFNPSRIENEVSKFVKSPLYEKIQSIFG